MPEGVSVHAFHLDIVDGFRLGDAVIVSSEIPGRFALKLCRSGIPFHLDSYNIAATELLAQANQESHGRISLHLFRRALRYGMLWERCEWGYLSSPVQSAVLGGMFLPRRNPRWARLAASLPAKCSIAPMGVPAPSGRNHPNPYPEVLRGRPILLWGGGIWSWFDIEGLLHAMSDLKGRGSPALIWFLASENPSGLSSQDEPVRRAKEMASDLNLLGTHVFFNPGSVSREMLPGFVEHCTAGVMSNPASLEAWCSWRTRLLDLMPAGKPLFSMGYDPLSEWMANAGAARMTPAGDISKFADAISAALSDPELLANMGAASLLAGTSMTWNQTLAPIRDKVSDPGSFTKVGGDPDWLDVARYVLGV
jgi:glycosyltransferase involved in cell wall biosynthesis